MNTMNTMNTVSTNLEDYIFESMLQTLIITSLRLYTGLYITEVILSFTLDHMIRVTCPWHHVEVITFRQSKYVFKKM